MDGQLSVRPATLDDARSMLAIYAPVIEELRSLGYVSAYAGIALPNPASVAVHEKLGFARIGRFPKGGFKFGAWHDVGWWYRALVPSAGEPDAPRVWRPSPGGD